MSESIEREEDQRGQRLLDGLAAVVLDPEFQEALHGKDCANWRAPEGLRWIRRSGRPMLAHDTPELDEQEAQYQAEVRRGKRILYRTMAKRFLRRLIGKA